MVSMSCPHIWSDVAFLKQDHTLHHVLLLLHFQRMLLTWVAFVCLQSMTELSNIYICHPNLIHSSWPECPVFLCLPILLAEIGAMKHTHTGCICWLACWWGHDQSPPWQLSSSCLAPSLGGWGGVLDPCFEDKCKTSPFSSSSSSAIHPLFFWIRIRSRPPTHCLDF